MPTLHEWLDGKTRDGVELDPDKVSAYRARRLQEKPQRPLTILQQVGSLASTITSTASRWIKGRKVFLDETEIADRLAICKSCDQYTGKSCKLCGCGCNGSAKLRNKLAHADSHCPHDPPKW